MNNSYDADVPGRAGWRSTCKRQPPLATHMWQSRDTTQTAALACASWIYHCPRHWYGNRCAVILADGNGRAKVVLQSWTKTSCKLRRTCSGMTPRNGRYEKSPFSLPRSGFCTYFRTSVNACPRAKFEDRSCKHTAPTV